MQIVGSFPSLTAEAYEMLISTLMEKFEYPALPLAFKRFIMETNGGYVSPGLAVDDEPVHEIVFDTPLFWSRDNDRPVTPALIHFFGVWVQEVMNYADIKDLDLCELVASNEHSKLEFGVLPEKMMSFAKCSHPDASDMLCLGLDERDMGEVYYYYEMWSHPGNFHGSYYDKKRAAILKKFDFLSEQEALNYEPARFELERVPFVKVASNLDDFFNQCRRVPAS